MYEDLKRRRLDLLWHAYQLSGPAPGGRRILSLEGQAAHEAGYADVRVLNFDIRELEKDGAVEPAYDHPAYDLAGFKPYYIPREGQRMLAEAGYPLD